MTNRTGPKPKTGVQRYRCGKVKREPELLEKEKAENMAVAIEARQRVFGVSKADAKTQLAGSAIGRLLMGSNLASGEQARAFSEAADEFREKRARFESAIDAKRLTTSTDYTGIRQGRSRDMEDPAYVSWCNAVRRDYAEIRRAILEADPLAMTMLEMVVIEDKEPRNDVTMGALRSGLNAVYRVLQSRRRAA